MAVNAKYLSIIRYDEITDRFYEISIKFYQDELLALDPDITEEEIRVRIKEEIVPMKEKLLNLGFSEEEVDNRIDAMITADLKEE